MTPPRLTLKRSLISIRFPSTMRPATAKAPGPFIHFSKAAFLIASDTDRGLMVMQLDLGNDADFNDDDEHHRLRRCGLAHCVDFVWRDECELRPNKRWPRDHGRLGRLEANGRRSPCFGPGAEVLPGDANLDGNVDGVDFLHWNDHKFQDVASWCAWRLSTPTVDVDGNDFLLWNDHKFTSSVQSVP